MDVILHAVPGLFRRAGPLDRLGPRALDRPLHTLRAAVPVRPLRQRMRDALLDTTDRGDPATFREDLARRYLRGEGIEIGALHRPLRLPPAARVRYVDIMSREQLLSEYSPLVYGNPKWVVDVDVIDDGGRLTTIEDGSLDFVIANHVLEHIEDPVAALENHVRVLRPGGILFLTLPDARYTFDVSRPRTTVDHVVRDHSHGPEVSRESHYREWALMECLPEERVAERVAQFACHGSRHHFHVWELEGFLELLAALALRVRLQLAQSHANEFAIVLRRDAPT